MNKNNYLNKLNLLLSQYDMPDETRKKIVDEYDYLWIQYESMQNSSFEIAKKLGKPESIIDDLVVGYSKKTNKKVNILKNLISLNNDYVEGSKNLKNDSQSLNEIRQNYVSKIKKLNKSFIKKTKNHHEMEKYRNLSIIFSILSVVVLLPYFFVSFTVDGAWAWSWQFFLFYPIFAILFFGPKRFVLKLFMISPIISHIIYFTLGMTLNIWHPTWLVFFLIPILGLFSITKEKND